MSINEVLDAWKEARAGLIAEVEQIPAEQFGFQATPESRSVAGILRHIIEAQTFFMPELCRPDTDFKRLPLHELMAKQAAESFSSGDKEELIARLKSTMEWAEATIRAFGEDALKEPVERLDGKRMSKLAYLQFLIAHEMHHRGQISVYERLMQIEPALTAKLREFIAANQ
jgi:uncharacterized damage-inducible protein DinB